ncbi:MAG TPA: tetratricopeptide repeat protein [Thermoanaerobaculia bacterium]|nr:tetratricopeptide repeat protein [Thermoanaerobaculia bacterium]
MHRTKVVFAVAILATPWLAGCHKVKARVELKNGNALYQQEEYRQALKQFQRGLELDPGATFAWRSVGLTALALYRPGDPGAENAKLGETAIEAFKKYLEDYPEDGKVREYLLTTLVQAKRYDEALSYLREHGDPNDPDTIRAQVNILIQANRYEDAWRLAQRISGEHAPEVLYSIGVATWDQAYRNPALNYEQRGRMVDTGLQALERALREKPDYFEAMAYYNLLFREKAKLEMDGAKRLEYIALADEWMNKALALRKKQQEAEKKAAKAATEADTNEGT